jgi:hypothetical protein
MKLLKTFIRDVSRSAKKWFFGRWSKANYAIAKAEAIRLSEQYHRKYYVMQSSPVHWRVFSTADVRHLKRTRVFKADLTFREMSEKSAFVAYPKNS